MCGILLHSFSDYPARQEELKHRGPDSFGCSNIDGVEFVHYRLSILDISPLSNQPFVCNEGILLFNGEIYNYIELAQKYNIEERFRKSDTLVIAQLLSNFGIRVIDEFKGMYSIIWLDRNKDVFVFRDRLGIKPLYFLFDGNDFAFCSEIRPLVSRANASPNKAKIFEYLSHGVVHRDTIWRNIKEVPVDSVLKFNLNARELERIPRSKQLSVKGHRPPDLDLLDSKLSKSVRLHLQSDVPVGLLLSGGIDSSLLAHYAAQFSKEIIAYTADFGVDIINNELDLARKYSKEIGIEHVAIKVGFDESMEHLDNLLLHHGQPFADAADVALSVIYNGIDSHHKVLLQGDGGDELFGGYRRHRYFPLLQGLPTGFRACKIRSRAFNFLHAYSKRSYIRHSCLLREDRGISALDFAIVEDSERFSAHYGPYKSLYESGKYDSFTELEKLYYCDLDLLLKNIFLKKVDISSMIHSKEVRVPYLYDDIIQYFEEHDVRANSNLLESKIILRKLARRYLPKYLFKQKKMGFGVPYAVWLFKEGESNYRAGLEVVNDIIPIRINKLMEHFRDPSYKFVHWKYFVLGKWLRKYC